MIKRYYESSLHLGILWKWNKSFSMFLGILNFAHHISNFTVYPKSINCFFRRFYIYFLRLCVHVYLRWKTYQNETSQLTKPHPGCSMLFFLLDFFFFFVHKKANTKLYSCHVTYLNSCYIQNTHTQRYINQSKYQVVSHLPNI